MSNKDSVTKYDSFDKILSTLDGWYEANGLHVALARQNRNEGESPRKQHHRVKDNGQGHKVNKGL
jgi:hypothetical protein